jgi:hypothetical protein
MRSSLDTVTLTVQEALEGDAMHNQSERSLLEQVVDAFEKIDKILGAVAVLVAAWTLSSGNRMLSYASVLVAYALFSVFLWRVVTQQSIIKSTILSIKPLQEKHVYRYSKMQRIVAGVALGFSTVLTIGWLVLPNVSKPAQITTKVTPAVGQGQVPAVSRSTGPRFAAEELNFDICIYGEPKAVPGETWHLVRNQSWFERAKALFGADKSPATISVLLLSPDPTVVEQLSLEIRNYAGPVSKDELQFYETPGCGRGAAPVPVAMFKPVLLNPLSSHYALVSNTETVQFPYSLGANEALVIMIPIMPNQPGGSFTLQLTARVVTYSGATLEIESRPLTYHSVYISSQDLTGKVRQK